MQGMGVRRNESEPKSWTADRIFTRRRTGASRIAAFFVGALATVAAAATVSAQDDSTGSIEGVVVDSKSGDPIIEAGVEVIGLNKKVKTDLDGKYSVELPAGSYELRIFAPLYRGTRLKNVVVTANKTTHADANLKPEGEAAVQTVEVVAEAKKAAETTQLLQRQKAAVVSDNISAQQIQKSPDAKASEVVRRVPAVTVKDSKYIVVRGLGERYSSALLTGSRLPSTDPNKRVIPLDLFPSDFIDALTLVKTYNADLPGDFAGGLLDIELREYPAKLTYSLGMSSGGNTETTFRDFESYDGCGSSDYFGLGGCRDLPSIFGKKPIAGGQNLTTGQQQRLAGALPVNWNVEHMTAPPNFSFGGSVGNSWGPFGVNLAAIYKTEYKRRNDETINSYPSLDALETGLGNNKFHYDRSNFETQLGAIFTSGYELSPNHKFFANALVNRHTDDQVLDGKGVTFVSNDFTTFSSNQLYTADQLGFGQIGGRDHWEWIDADWRAAWSPANEDQPDAKFIQYQQTDPSLPPTLSDSPSPPTRTFGQLDEFLQDYNANLAVPFATRLPFTDFWSGLPAKFKTGAAYMKRDRDFNYRIFNATFNNPNLARLGDRSREPDDLLIPPNFGSPEDGFPLSFEDISQVSGSFDASHEIAGGYGMFDLPLVRDRLRLVAGVRLEYSYIRSNGFFVNSGGAPANARLNNLDPLPAVNFIFTPRSDMNVRYSISQTVSRPELRELTPTQFVVAIGQRSFQGNPDLEESHILGNDLRWEWFFAPSELASASFFYKDIDKPIEIVAISQTSLNVDIPNNADSATLWGFEFEVRKNFGFLGDYATRHDVATTIAPELRNLQFQSNVAIVQSNAEGLDSPVAPNIPPVIVTHPSRSLTSQANYVVNAALEYQHARWGSWRILYNTVGPYVVAAGVEGLPDIKQQPHHQLDAVWLGELKPFGTPVTARVAIENLINDRYLQTQGDKTTNRYDTGVKFTFWLSYTY